MTSASPGSGWPSGFPSKNSGPPSCQAPIVIGETCDAGLAQRSQFHKRGLSYQQLADRGPLRWRGSLRRKESHSTTKLENDLTGRPPGVPAGGFRVATEVRPRAAAMLAKPLKSRYLWHVVHRGLPAGGHCHVRGRPQARPKPAPGSLEFVLPARTRSLPMPPEEKDHETVPHRSGHLRGPRARSRSSRRPRSRGPATGQVARGRRRGPRRDWAWRSGASASPERSCRPPLTRTTSTTACTPC